MTQKIALGKGLSALIPEADRAAIEGRLIQEIPCQQVRANRYQPRLTFDQESLHELARSIKERGIIQPILVRAGTEGYELIAGERRLKAAVMAGLQNIPAIILDNITPLATLELALIENLQRQDLNPIEEARAYARLMADCGFTQDQIADKIGKDRASVANTVRLLSLPEQIQNRIEEGRISAGHGRVLLRLATPELQLEMADYLEETDLSVRQLEEMVQSPLRTKKRRLIFKRTNAIYVSVETALRNFFGTAVSIKRQKKRGKIIIEFYSDEDLSRIIEKLNLSI